MDYNVKIGRSAKKYIKKLKEKALKKKFTDAIYEKIAKNPEVGNAKTGDLLGYYTYNFKHNSTQYRIAYSFNKDGEIVIVILAGPHEGFYEQLKRIIRTKK